MVKESSNKKTNSRRKQVNLISLKNLEHGKKFKPGEVHNPKGRPPKPSCLTSWLKEDLAKLDPATGKTNAQLIAEKMVTDAKAGVASARAEIFERVEGKVAQPLSGAGGGPVQYDIKVVSDIAKEATKKILDGERTKV